MHEWVVMYVVNFEITNSNINIKTTAKKSNYTL